MKTKPMILLTSAFMLFSVMACGGSTKVSPTNEQEKKTVVNVPQFHADSAFLYVKEQVDFGPRVPNTQGHVACGNYLAQRLKEFGAQVTDQYADLIAYDGTLLKARNIIGSYKPESKKRIALFAHWDTRPWADNDPDKKNHQTPILGANDGASGVGVLLEIARQIQTEQPALGIDLILLDAEDYGAHGQNDENSWCLGAQYWGRNPHADNYNARFGILLDMVGGENTVFMKEYYSENFAPDINKKIWKAAKKAGYGHLFINEEGGGVTDDHLFINRLARIKTIDIIGSDPKEGGFSPTWHTLNDTMDHIDKNTLKAVGQTVLEVIYNEK